MTKSQELKGSTITNTVCPRCGDSDMAFPALSRTDNKSKVCSQCGRIEAIEQMVTGHPLPQDYWSIND